MALSRSTRFLRIIHGKRFLFLLVTWKVEAKVQVWVYASGLLLKSEPPKGPLSTGLIPQFSNNLIPLCNQSYLLMKVPTQSPTLLIQPSAKFTASEASRRATSSNALASEASRRAASSCVILSFRSLLAARSSSRDSRSSPRDVMSSSLTI